MSAGCPVCGATASTVIKRYATPPPGETDFGLAPYERVLRRCDACGHVINDHAMYDRLGGYDGGYVDATYGDRMAASFARIMALPPEKSDNRQRVAAVDSFAQSAIGGRGDGLDVGSGLGVFPAAMAARGWAMTALDPDPRAAAHADGQPGVRGVAADFHAWTADRRYALVTLNKVLEHVPDMAGMLRRCADCLTDDGVLYVEVPDGEGALAGGGPDREEFFVEHYCAFSAASLSLLIGAAGWRLDRLDRVVEPSGKYTWRAFCRRP